MSFKEYIESKKIEQRLANLTLVRKEINLSWVKTKINNFIKRMGGIFTYEEIYNEILTNDIVAAMFAKDPGRQNISENLVQTYLNISKEIEDVRFDETGKIYYGYGAQPGLTKNADFCFNGIYITQKYTGENNGGAQDNQYNDVIQFLTYGSKKQKVGALVDGWYWEEGGKRKQLEKYFQNNPNVYIFSADDYKEYGDDIFV